MKRPNKRAVQESVSESGDPEAVRGVCRASGEAAPLPVRQLLIALRRDRGVTSNELARRLGVLASDLLCNERNQYGGMTVQEATMLTAILIIGPSTVLILVSAVAAAEKTEVRKGA